MAKAQDKIIIALDGMDVREALAFAARAADLCWGFKVNDLLTDQGVRIIEQLKAFGRVFADPKLHDIPNTVANSIKRLESAGADLITVHASGGLEMLKTAAESTASAKILAVTALTSMSDKDTQQIYQRTAASTVEFLAKLAQDAGINGIVCSPHELQLLKNLTLLKVTPGIRPSISAKDDQKRTLSPKEAFNLGASMLVIGRPITKAPDPLAALQDILKELV